MQKMPYLLATTQSQKQWCSCALRQLTSQCCQAPYFLYDLEMHCMSDDQFLGRSWLHVCLPSRLRMPRHTCV